MKYVQDLFSENYKILQREIKEVINGKIHHTHGLEDLILLISYRLPSH